MNVADGPTRPDKFDVSDMGPGSVWELGLPWMHEDLDVIIDQGILTPVSHLVVKDDEKQEYDEGFVMERSPDILTRGHLLTSPFAHYTSSSTRLEKVAIRASFSNYLIMPTKYSFDKVVRITALAYKFCKAFLRKWTRMFNHSLLHKLD